MKPTLAELEAAAQTVHAVMAPTPQYSWPLLNEQLGTEVWVKHENHTPAGAFKIRGGLVYFDRLRAQGSKISGAVCATRGNHGQSVAFAARRYGLNATIVVPHGNSREKNAAMRGLGAHLIEHGEDFQAAREHAALIAQAHNLHVVPSFHPWLVAGVGSYALELFRAVADIDIAYVPIGLGSGICGMIAARDALALRTEIVGVVSSHAPAYAHSFAAKKILEHPVSTRLADGIACRTPEVEALQIIWQGASRVMQVSDLEIATAIGLIYETTHNVCEGAGAAAVAAVLQEKSLNAGRKVAVILTGANIDRELFAGVLTTSRQHLF